MTSGATELDPYVYLLILAALLAPLAAFVAIMAHRERLEDEAVERGRDVPAE